MNTANTILEAIREKRKQAEAQASDRIAKRYKPQWNGYAWIRLEQRPRTFRPIPQPKKILTSNELLKRFYYLNPTAHDNGHSTRRLPWYHDQTSFHAFQFTDRFIVFIRQDKDTEEHSIHLNHVSAFDGLSRWIASAPMHHVEMKHFWKPERWQDILKRQIILKKFRIITLHENTDIPIY